LNDTKDKSASIAVSLRGSTALQDSLELEGNVYLPVIRHENYKDIHSYMKDMYYQNGLFSLKYL
jgi:hypothetical protein